jgi:hypothetical protein
MSDIRDMPYTTETIDRTIGEPYTGKRYGGMSDDVVFASLTVAYRFDGFEVIVDGVPAKWDRKTGSEYITGKVGRTVHEHVGGIADALHGQQARGETTPPTEIRDLEDNVRKIVETMVRGAPKSISIHPALAA